MNLPTEFLIVLPGRFAAQVYYDSPLNVELDAGQVAGTVEQISVENDNALRLHVRWTALGKLAFEAGRRTLGTRCYAAKPNEISHVFGFVLVERRS